MLSNLFKDMWVIANRHCTCAHQIGKIINSQVTELSKVTEQLKRKRRAKTSNRQNTANNGEYSQQALISENADNLCS